MENDQKTHQAIKRGSFWAPIYLILFIPIIIISFLASWYPNNLVIEIIAFAAYWGSLIAGILFYLGVLALGKERKEEKLVKHMQAVILLSVVLVVLSVVVSLQGILSTTTQLILSIGYLPLFVGLGIVALLLAKDFKRLESDFGTPATKAASWHKISGWLLVTVILSPIGGLFSLIADYYMWRVLQEAAKRHHE